MVIPRYSKAFFPAYILFSSGIFPIIFLFIQIKFIDWSQSLCLNFSNTWMFSLYMLQSRESRDTYAHVMGTFRKHKLSMLSVGPFFFFLEHVTPKEQILPCPYMPHILWGPAPFEAACGCLALSVVSWVNLYNLDQYQKFTVSHVNYISWRSLIK